MENEKLVYFFGNGFAEGNAEMRNELGGKGANLAEMTNLGIPVPPGFTISTHVCKQYYDNEKKYPPTLKTEVAENLRKLEEVTGKKLGDAEDPLLVSVRSGAAQSMPGMMDTILNLGMNDKAVLALSAKTGNARFAWDAYRRFIQMFGDVAMGVSSEAFEEKLSELKRAENVQLDTELDAAALESLVKTYKAVYKKHTGSDFPQNPIDQLWGAIDAVFGSWMNDRAIKYRRLNNIQGLAGTAVNIQAMVFGNYGEDSGTGVCFSRNPSSGVNEFYGEYLMNAQGEDVVAGIRTPEKIEKLQQENSIVYNQLVEIKNRLEKHYRDMQDMEFTVQSGKLFILQTRNGKRTGLAAVKCACDMVNEKLISKQEAILRVSPDQIDQLLHPMISASAKQNASMLTKGLNASPGAACGQIVYSAEEAEAWTKEGKKVILVRKETSPEDITGMVVSEGILTSTGGMTSHAAVVARGMGAPCVCGASDMTFKGENVTIGGVELKKGDVITIDGTTGEVFAGALPLIPPDFNAELKTFLSWCDDVRAASVRKCGVHGFKVRANADLPADAKKAFEFGAEGIGLCRTEHMFFDPEKLIHFRAMIASDTTEQRKEALAKILPLQKQDFLGIFEAMNGRAVTIRLLDPPLHEFVPHTPEETAELAAYMGTDAEKLAAKLDKLHEMNPMLGHRGCRLAITFPEIYETQVEAISLAAAECIKRKIPVHPEIMIPIVCDVEELNRVRLICENVMKTVFAREGVDFNIRVGTMIEVPRAALLADRIAGCADFFSFGTNDLTQMTFAFSRDDAGKFIPSYYQQGILKHDPFKTIDEDGVGQLIRLASNAGRSVQPELKLGICGEHGGDPETIDFCYRAGLNYVSCSPFRVPVARLAASQAVLRHSDI